MRERGGGEEDEEDSAVRGPEPFLHRAGEGESVHGEIQPDCRAEGEGAHGAGSAVLLGSAGGPPVREGTGLCGRARLVGQPVVLQDRGEVFLRL